MRNQRDDDNMGEHDPSGPSAETVPSEFLRNSLSINAFNLNMYAFDQIVIVAYSFDSTIAIFNFLYLYFYNTYFSIIVLKLAEKILQKYRQSRYYKYYRLALIAVFAIYTALVLIALIYRIVESHNTCLCKDYLNQRGLSLLRILSALRPLYFSYVWGSSILNGNNREQMKIYQMMSKTTLFRDSEYGFH